MGSPRDDNGCRGAARDVGRSAALTAAVSLICLLLALFVIASSTSGGNIREEHAATAQRRAVYSASVTQVDGLYGYLLVSRSLYKPVFHLTVHVKVPAGGENDVCIGGHSVAAVVSYGDAFPGKGSVPRLCVEPNQEDPLEVMAWGMGVRIPQVMQSRLDGELKRGEAEVEVAVPMRGGEVHVCKPKIGGGPSPPCTLEEALN